MRPQFIWNEEPGGNVEHIEEHGITVDDVEHVLAGSPKEEVSRSSGLPCVFGTTLDGRYIIIVYERIGRGYRLSRHRLRSPGTVIFAEDRFMAEKKFKRIERPATAEERKRHAAIRAKVMQEFPPAPGAGREQSPPGLPTQIRQAREAQGLTWYALAKLAGIPNANTVRDIEYGCDAQISSVQAVAKALGLRLELVEESV